MTIEEKVKAYDRVSKEVKDFFEGRQKMYSDVEQTLEYLFPELAESEDEEIRKEIIHYFTEGKEYLSLCSFSKEEVLTWLEEQGEQKPQRMISAEAKEAIYGKPAYAWSEEDEEHIHSLLDRLEGMCKKDATFTATRFAVNQDIDWLKSLKEKIGG